MNISSSTPTTAPSRGLYANTGNGPSLVPFDIRHPDYLAVVDPDTAFWSLVPKEKLADAFSGGRLARDYQGKASQFAAEMETLRFGLKPSCVYFNATERCNMNCAYCYIPAEMRQHGRDMTFPELRQALAKLKAYFATIMDKDRQPSIIFHGAEPLVNREAIFAAIDAFHADFRFGIQTNGTLLDAAAAEFIKSHGVGLGLSLDGATAAVANRTRVNWNNDGMYDKALQAIDLMQGYEAFNVICTVTRENMAQLPEVVDFFHRRGVPACMLNLVRCTLPPSREVKPADHEVFPHFLRALERSYELYQQTGRKLVVVNFANILLAILAPSARRLMCDLSPCGGGRSFFAVVPNGDLFPCSEFIGVPEFKGGNLFTDEVEAVLKSVPFERVTSRKVENIEPCQRCAIRHFCGAPCPAEAFQMNGGRDRTGAFCEFYEEQARYAFRLIADQKHEAFLWDGWAQGTEVTFQFKGEG